VAEEFRRRTGERAATRAEVIAETEVSRAASVGEIEAVKTKRPLTKTWLPTTSRDPRVAHLAQIGETIPFVDTFPDGSWWSNELPNCKCGIRVGYAK
jgi:hypothetical protein